MTEPADGRAVGQASRPPRRTQEERSEHTRGLLIAAARGLFGEHGYVDTSTNAIVAGAGVTRGALYHHFVDKADLFEAVYRALQQELRDEALAAATAVGSPPREQVRAGLQAYLDYALRPEVQRIALTDAPAVLGWRRWRAIDREFSLGLLTTGFEVAHRPSNHDPHETLERAADILFAVLNESSLLIASAADPAVERESVGVLMDRVLDSLL